MGINYLLPYGTGAMVVPEAVIAKLTGTSEETFQTEGDVGLVVLVAVRIAVRLAAYHIIGGCLSLLPDDLVDCLLEVGQSIHILRSAGVRLSFEYKEGKELTSVLFLKAAMSLSTSSIFAAAWSI